MIGINSQIETGGDGGRRQRRHRVRGADQHRQGRSCPGSSTAVPVKLAYLGHQRRARPRQAATACASQSVDGPGGERRDRARRRGRRRSTADRVVVDGRAPGDPRHAPAGSDGDRSGVPARSQAVVHGRPSEAGRNSRLSRRRGPARPPTMWVMEAWRPEDQVLRHHLDAATPSARPPPARGRSA